jgi:hypothetical protein
LHASWLFVSHSWGLSPTSFSGAWSFDFAPASRYPINLNWAALLSPYALKLNILSSPCLR